MRWGSAMIALSVLMGCTVDVDRFGSSSVSSTTVGTGGMAATSTTSTAGGGGAGGRGGSSGTGGSGGAGPDPPDFTSWCLTGGQLFADDFDRTMPPQSGWGAGNPGPGEYVIASGEPKFSVVQGQGQYILNVPNLNRAHVSQESVTSIETEATVAFNVYPASGPWFFASLLLFDSGNDRWEARLRYNPGTPGTVVLQLVEVTGGVGSAMNVMVDTMPSASVGYHVRFRVDARNSPTRLQATAWRTDAPPPTSWLIDEEPSTVPFGPDAGFGAGADQAGVDLVVRWDDVRICAAGP